MVQKLKINVYGNKWIEVDKRVFNAWSGGRRLNGRAYTGPIIPWGFNPKPRILANSEEEQED